MSSAKMVSGFVASVSKLAYHTLSISTNQSIDLQISLLKQNDLQATNTLVHIKLQNKRKNTYLNYLKIEEISNLLQITPRKLFWVFFV